MKEKINEVKELKKIENEKDQLLITDHVFLYFNGM